MKARTLILLAVVVALVAPLSAGYAALDQLTVADTAVGLTAAKIREGNGHPQANKGYCVVSTAAIRYRDDGGTPTSTVGVPAQVGDTLQILSPESLVKFRAIRSTSTSAALDCLVYE